MEIDQKEKRIILPIVVDRTNVSRLDEALQSLYEEGCPVIRLDCVNLEMIDSAGLGSFVLYQKKMKERGGELIIVNVINDYIQHLFDVIELNRVITIE